MLWQKPTEELSFQDVDDFLKTKRPEGNRLDYKLIVPNDLAKTIAAFANTLGGIIVLGVDGDKVSNEPIWPPQAGLPDSSGLADRIIQIATEAIYPPVRVSVAQMENALLPGHQIVVVRVDESREAPHAVEKKRKIYVYDRSDNKNGPHVLADIDRIKYLLGRRKAIEAKREQLIEKGTAKLRAELEKGLKPQCWVAVAPVYPWRDICRPSECYNFFQEIARTIGHPQNTQATVQRVPDGAFMRVNSLFDMNKRTLRPTDAALVRSDGVFLYMRTILSLDRSQPWGVALLDHEHTEKQFQMPSFWERIPLIFGYARAFYSRAGIELPGLLSLQLGFEGMRDFTMFTHSGRGLPYTEDEYKDNDFVDTEAFLKPDNNGLELLRKRFFFGFDVETPEGM